LTAEERVDAVVDRLIAERELSPQQEAWLNRIREHLIQNLTIDRQDFELLPIFTRVGGWAPADRAFGGELGDLLKDLNEAIAA
jgi:type I restriction enzyme R subunit